jgi:hypothetical protein
VRFEKNNTHSTGRPKGSRNRWTNELIDTMFKHFLDPAAAKPTGERTRVEAAMDVCYRQRPEVYFKAARDLLAQLAPKVQVSGSLTDLNDEQLDKLDTLLTQLEQQPPEALN